MLALSCDADQVNPVSMNAAPLALWRLGLVLIAVGGAWFLFSFNWLYSLVVILLVVAALAIAAALKRK